MNQLDRIARGLLRPINPFSTLIFGVFTTLWGIWLLLPWQVFQHAQLFSKMHTFAPETAWGSWATLTGLLILWAVFGGYYRWLSWSLLFASWHWTAVSVFLWWGDWQNTGGLTYTSIDIFCIYAYLNIRVNCVKYGEDIPNFYE